MQKRFSYWLYEITIFVDQNQKKTKMINEIIKERNLYGVITGVLSMYLFML
jgi:hypothetical protein